ncbi:MAG: hypothetical protein QXE01_05955 [Sulfolobales archaeon]
MVRKRISLFRELDSMIDFSKSSYQLDIVVFMGSVGKPVSIDAIVSALGVDRKQVLDAIRKLRLKGIVETKGGFYILTDNGRKFYDALIKDLVTGVSTAENYGDVVKLAKRFRSVAIAIDVIRLIGVWGRPLKLHRVAKSFNMNVAGLLEMLSPFIRDMGGDDIIRLVDCREGYLRRKVVRCLTLSKSGIDIIRGMPEVKRYRILYRMVGYITRSLTLEKAFERLLIYIAVISTAMILLQRTAYGKIALVAGFVAITFFVSLYLASLKISKLYMS